MPVFGELQASSAPQMPGCQQGQLLSAQEKNVSRSEGYLGLPFHASQGDAQQHRHSDDPNDSDVIGGVHDEGIVLLEKGNYSQHGNNPLPYQTTVFSTCCSSHCWIISGPMIMQILITNTGCAGRRWGWRGGGTLGPRGHRAAFLPAAGPGQFQQSPLCAWPQPPRLQRQRSARWSRPALARGSVR